MLVLLGALTGRDGIGGASVLASAELGEGDEAKRPSVQIGDPFAEKKLIECCLELLDRELLVSLQDLGAAGLTSSASEMASKGGVGLDIDVSRVPLREPGMEPFEIMVSESQERMLCVVEPERVGEVIDVCERWETLATPIGSVTESGTLRVLDARQRGRRAAGRRCSSTTARCTTSSPTPPDARALPRPAGGAERRRVAGRDAAGAARARPTSPRAGRCSSSTTRSSSRAPCAGPSEADAAVLAAARRRARSRSSIDGNGRRVACDPAARARPRRSTSARPTSPASAPSRSG